VQRAVVYGVARVTEWVGNESGRDDQGGHTHIGHFPHHLCHSQIRQWQNPLHRIYRFGYTAPYAWWRDILISYETMKTVYKSKVDKGLLIAIIAIVLLSYLPLLFEFSWIALALLVVTAAFIADPFCNTSYDT